ncbi:MAG: pentapeptide repeat-containing protein [Gammaproteobacteria bacterium]|nr:pentapeptide repeat-containing protein [Gammaproteobacteria bacterium]MCP5407223.1 pentapeptide repeat-containing protein [Chromatiaceae bacterium]MCP5408222.1 pentapeptide repeat-containing protein [Chromatiaceae bacterium]MCP5442033.1 pentapeptide repeat-containing protein [Chromatiaceae bacterium]
MVLLNNDDPLYRLLREGLVEEFNRRRRDGDECDLRACDLRSLDLRKLDAAGMDLRDCYLRQADLRGVDLTHTNLEGSSINGAKISGTLFPVELSAEEITLSLLHGTRMRYRK